MSLTLNNLSISVCSPQAQLQQQQQRWTSSPTLKFKFKPKPKPTLSLTRASSSSASVSVSLAELSVGEDLPSNYGDWLPKTDPDLRRRAGILLHPTSFRGPYGIGDLGDEAFRFIDWLHLAGCSLWQVPFLILSSFFFPSHWNNHHWFGSMPQL